MWRFTNALATPPCRMPKGPDRPRGTAGVGLDSLAGRAATIETAHRKGSHHEHNATCRQPDREELQRGAAYRYRSRQLNLISGQVGVAIPPNNKPISFEQEVRVTFDRIRKSLRKLDADMDKIVSIKVYLTDLAPYAEFSKVRGEVFPHNPPTSSAVQVAGLLLGARIEIDAVAFIAKG